MPFTRQNAGKTGHEDVIWNPDIESYLGTLGNTPKPELADLGDAFKTARMGLDFYAAKVPEIIVAFDGSLYEASADSREPSRRVGYVKVGMVALNVKKYLDLSVENMPYVDPMAVNKLQDNSAVSMALPSAYLLEVGQNSITDGYRAAIHRYYSSDKTKMGTDTNMLLDTVVELLRLE